MEPDNVAIPISVLPHNSGLPRSLRSLAMTRTGKQTLQNYQ